MEKPQNPKTPKPLLFLPKIIKLRNVNKLAIIKGWKIIKT